MESFSVERGTRNFDVFDLRLNKRLGKQSWSWWFETLLHHYGATVKLRLFDLHVQHFANETLPEVCHWRDIKHGHQVDEGPR